MMPQRVMLIGGPGSGKTWLANRIGALLDLPVIAVDDLLHDQSGQLRPAGAIDRDAVSAASSDHWVIEGGNSRTYQARLDRADWLIRLKPSVALRLWRVLRRGNATPELIRWTVLYDRVFGPKDDAIVTLAKGQTQVSDVRNRQDLMAVLQACRAHPASPLRP